MKNHESLGSQEYEPSKEAQEIGKAALETLKQADLEELKYWASEYCNIERAFSKRDTKTNLQEYEKWEDEADEAFSKVEEVESRVTFDSIYDRDATERLAIIDGRDSIEAYAGSFYEERNYDLLTKIKNSDTEDSENDGNIVRGLHELVAKYIYASKDYEAKRRSPKDYQNNRGSRHNDVIKRINEINEIAEKYGAKPFTFRNFITNDFPYDKKLDWSGATDARADYDRSAVEGYIRNAFTRDFDELDKGNGDIFYDPNESLVAQFHTRD